MFDGVKGVIAKKLLAGQLRPDQVAWLEKNQTLPTEVILQFFLSPEGAKVLQLSVDALMKEADKVLTKVAELTKK